MTVRNQAVPRWCHWQKPVMVARGIQWHEGVECAVGVFSATDARFDRRVGGVDAVDEGPRQWRQRREHGPPGPGSALGTGDPARSVEGSGCQLRVAGQSLVEHRARHAQQARRRRAVAAGRTQGLGDGPAFELGHLLGQWAQGRRRSGGRPGGDGNYASTSVAINGLYGLALFGSDRARSYVGLGAVYLTEVDIDFEQGATETSFSGSKGGLQVLLGVRYELGARAFLDVGLRYLVARNIELDADAPAVGRIRADYEPLAVTAAFAWKF